MAIDRSDYSINIKTTGEFASVKDGREAFHALKLAAGEALGPIGELAHFISNPYLLAVAGITLAIKMLIEQHEKLIETTRKNIELSEEQRRLFADAHATAIRTVTSEIEKMADAQKHAHDGVDLLTEAMARQIAAQQESNKTYATGTDAALSLYEARIKLMELEGTISGPQANAQLQAAKEQAQARKDEAEYQEKVAEANEHVRRSGEATGEAGRARGLIAEGSSLRNEQTRTNEEVSAATGIIANLTASLPDLRKTVDDLKAQIAVSPDLPNQTFNLKAPRLKAAQDAEAAAAGALLDEQKKLASYQTHLSAIEADIKQQEELAKSREDLAKAQFDLALETKAAAEALKQRNAITASSAHDTARINRRITLEGNAHRTPDEEAELQGMQEPQLGDRRNRSGGIDRGALSNASIVVRGLEDNRRRGLGGHASAQVNEEIHNLLNRVIGLGENNQADQGYNRDILADLSRRLHDLEARSNGNRWSP